MITVIMTAEVSKMADYIICNGKIVNGKNEAPFEGNIIIEGSRIKEITKTTEFPSDFPTERILDAGIAENEIILGNKEYFCIGDNPNNSEDSRSANIGPVEEGDMIGKAWFHLKSGTDGIGFIK